MKINENTSENMSSTTKSKENDGGKRIKDENDNDESNKRNNEKETLKNLVKNKKVFLATHWDADGVTSAAMLYHYLKRYSKIIGTNSKGVIFKIEKEDINDNADLTIVTDIVPGETLDSSKTIYIDHHPFEGKSLLKIHDDSEQSCSLLIWKKIIYPAILDYEISFDEVKYFTFLTLLGYFGDGGKEEDIPMDLYVLAKEVIPELLEIKSYGNRSFLEIERYVPLMNIGKRAYWNGNLPLEMLITTSRVEDIVYNLHPLAKKLNEVRREMSKEHKREIEIMRLKNIDLSIIESENNIQGVLCARYMDDKPIMVINKYDNYAIGSMRVPENLDFDAGKFLSELSNSINVLEGGGHEKAGGITIYAKDLEKFIEKLKEIDERMSL